MKNGPMSDFMAAAGLLIENAKSIPDILSAVSAYGYGAEELERGLALWEAADALIKKKALDSGESQEATRHTKTVWEIMNTNYMKTLKVARIAFEEDVKAATALKLYGPRQQSLTGWLGQAETFYGNLLNDKKLMEKMGRFGYDAEKVTREAEGVAHLKRNSQSQAKESGEAKETMKERDKKVSELDKWVSDFRGICKIAFYESPEQLLKLGIMGTVRKSRKKPAAVEAGGDGRQP